MEVDARLFSWGTHAHLRRVRAERNTQTRRHPDLRRKGSEREGPSREMDAAASTKRVQAACLSCFGSGKTSTKKVRRRRVSPIGTSAFVLFRIVRSLSLSRGEILFARKGRDADLKFLLRTCARLRAAVDRRGEDAARRAKRIEQQQNEQHEQHEQQDHLGAPSPIGQERFSGTTERIHIIQRKTRV